MSNASKVSVPMLLAVPLVALALAACGKQEQAAQPTTADASQPAADATQPATGATPGEQAAAQGVAQGAPAATPAGPPQPIPHIDPIESTPALAEAGKKLYFSAGCNACHGGTGGGGMCPPLTNDIWVYGSDDSTLHALIKDGSAAMQGTHALKRVGVEKVVGIMPPFGSVLDDEEINKVLAFIHSISPTAGKGETPKPGTAASAAGAGGR